VEDNVGANESALLILEEALRGSRLKPFSEIRSGQYLISLGWLLTRRLRGARLLSPSLELSKIEEVVPQGPGPSTLGAPIFSYVLLLVLGWLTLSTPLLVRLRLSKARVLTLDEAKALVIQVVKESSMDRKDAARLEQQVRKAGSARLMAQALDHARE
jgi:hypothetical protein